MDRNQLRNQESRTLGSLDLIMDLMHPFGHGFTKRSQAQEEMIKSHNERSIRTKPETHGLRIGCPTASRFEEKSI